MLTIDELKTKFQETQIIPEAADRLEGLQAVKAALCAIEEKGKVWGAIPLVTLKATRAFFPEGSAAVNRTAAIVNRQQAMATEQRQ